MDEGGMIDVSESAGLVLDVPVSFLARWAGL